MRGKNKDVHACIGRESASPLSTPVNLGARQAFAQPAFFAPWPTMRNRKFVWPISSSCCCTWASRATFFSTESRPTKPSTCRGLRGRACACPDGIARRPHRAASGGRAGRLSAPKARKAPGWAQTEPAPRVELGRGGHGQVSIFCPVAADWRSGSRRRNHSERRASVLVHIGVPTGGQRQLHVVRQARAQHSHLAGAGDVDQIGLKALQHFADQRDVAQKRGIEAQILFESKGEKAARQLQRPHIAVFEKGLSAGRPRGRKERADCAAARRPQSGGWYAQPRLLHETSRESRPRAAIVAVHLSGSEKSPAWPITLNSTRARPGPGATGATRSRPCEGRLRPAHAHQLHHAMTQLMARGACLPATVRSEASQRRWHRDDRPAHPRCASPAETPGSAGWHRWSSAGCDASTARHTAA